MKKGDKQILKYLIQKELEMLKEDKEEVVFPSLDFLKSSDVYEKRLKDLLKEV